jgi:hypothetical protein
MNPIFSPIGEGWPSFPKRSFGKLDQSEPIAPKGASVAVFCFDVVDADWSGFGDGGLFDLGSASRLKIEHARYWQGLFGQNPIIGPDPYDQLPIYRVEITASPGDVWFDLLITITEGDWVTIELDDSGQFEVDVFGALLAAPVTASLKDIQKDIPETAALNAAFSMDSFSDATSSELSGAISCPSVDYLIGFDVGQGAAVGLADSNEDVHLYFDLGGGVYRNAPTRPKPLRFCWRVDAPIVLSHWDSDHWSGELTDPQARSRTWIAPRQSITKKHFAFANRLLKAGANLLIWGAAPTTLRISLGSGNQTLELRRCTGSSSLRNGSGIAGIVEDGNSGKQWLLTGDAGYHEIGTLPSNPVAIVVPHHGADMGSSSTPPTKPTAYARLIYSFGPGNRHGRKPGVQHPTVAAMNAHQSQAWDHGTWTGSTAGNTVATKDVLATAQHPGTHLDGAVAGWASAPTVPLTTLPCAAAGVPSGCTGAIRQA